MKKQILVGFLLCSAFLTSCGIFDEPSPSTPEKDSTPISEPSPSLPNSEDTQPSIPEVPSENPQPSIPTIPSENPSDSPSTQGPIKVDDTSDEGNWGPLH